MTATPFRNRSASGRFAGDDVSILGIGTELPQHRVPQATVLAHVTRQIGVDTRAARIARRLFEGARVEHRHFCIPDFSDTPESPLFGHETPSLTERMSIFRREAPRLAATACLRALEHAGVPPREVTHLVVVTSTGIGTPGVDVDVATTLGLEPTVERTLVSFMGCAGAFPGIRVARRAARDAREARVLLACVELSSIHGRPTPDPGNLAGHALFGDGAAALLLATGVDPDRSLADLGPAQTGLRPELADLVTWTLGDEGFELRLSRDLPRVIEQAALDFVEPFLGGTPPKEIPSWAVHPGGIAILGAIERALGLPPERLASSYAVLREAGNLSSPAVLFVLERELRRCSPGDEGIILGFGPGLTFEILGLRRGGRAD